MTGRFKLQLLLALFWFLSVYLAVGAIVPWTWAWRCAWLNLIIGMLALLWITRTDVGDRLFYKGPEGNEPGRLEVAVLWAVPVVVLFLAVIWWTMRLLGFFD
jgi:hypothetical protein